MKAHEAAVQAAASASCPCPLGTSFTAGQQTSCLHRPDTSTPLRALSPIAESQSCSFTHPEAAPVIHDRGTLCPGQGGRYELLNDWQLVQGICSLQSLHRLQRPQQHVLVGVRGLQERSVLSAAGAFESRGCRAKLNMMKRPCCGQGCLQVCPQGSSQVHSPTFASSAPA